MLSLQRDSKPNLPSSKIFIRDKQFKLPLNFHSSLEYYSSKLYTEHRYNGRGAFFKAQHINEDIDISTYTIQEESIYAYFNTTDAV